VISLLVLLPHVISAVDPEPLIIQQVVSDGSDGSSADHLLNADHHFSLFKSKFGKAYSTQEEHDYRLSVFKSNLRRAMRHQAADPSAVHGVTKFSDLTPAEFQRSYLGLKKGKF
ncbi:hypothetical protein, partial [Salmonella sp. s57402]|uniref:hypothetical protein n=1 Tax=Salmonella sp. s57402 TaxID=3159695 RepID=UPI00398128B7